VAIKVQVNAVSADCSAHILRYVDMPINLNLRTHRDNIRVRCDGHALCGFRSCGCIAV